MKCPWEEKGNECGTVCMCEAMDALGQYDEWAEANEGQQEAALCDYYAEPCTGCHGDGCAGCHWTGEKDPAGRFREGEA